MEPDLNPDRASRGFLRRWFRRATPAPRVREAAVIAFASGKGGTGKSFLVTNAALALHNEGLRVAVVDCDFGLGNAHLLFGVNPRYSMQHLLDDRVPVQQVLQRTPFGPNLLAGGSGIASLADLDARHMQALGRALRWVASQHDVVLLDCAAGLSPQSLITVLAAQEVVLVTNPEIAALTDAYALIKCLARQGRHPSIQLVVNRVTQAGLGQATFARLAEVARRFVGCSIHYLGEVPEDPAVTHRRLGQPPLLRSLPECETTKALQVVFREISRQVQTMRDAVGPGVEERMAEQIQRW